MPERAAPLDGSDPAAVTQAAQRLAAGGLVAFPTETVYGLGARADDDAAVSRIFSAKGRPSDHPLIVHVADAPAARAFAAAIPQVAQGLIDAFWPGPLSVIVPRRLDVATAAAGGQATVGLRCPSHPVARALLIEAAKLGVHGVAAPSANRFGRISPTCADHVAREFADLSGDALCILDGGACPVGIESTIIDCSQGRAVLLRPGTLTRAQLQAVCGELLERQANSPRASGTLQAHYAPRTPLRLMSTADLQHALALLYGGALPAGGPAPVMAVYSRSSARTLGVAGVKQVVHRVMPAVAATAAQQLFATLRELDASGAQLIWVETPPADPEWEGVLDRLQRAAAAA